VTPNKEDYLKEIYKLGGTTELVTNKQLADKLNIAPASVTEMLGKLSNDGLIEYQAYKGSKLTSKGLQTTTELVRRHRLWEVFLTQHLGYSWSEAHEDAHLLEHITPARLITRLDTFLNHPAHCPHGSTIPHSGGQINKAALVPLIQLKAGQFSYIRQFAEEKELLDYLQDMRINIGDKITIVSIGAYEGPLVLAINGVNVQISYKAACHVYVDEQPHI